MKIGVFDSGLGGLTVLKSLWAHLPGADYVYLGDTARVPYGIRSKDVVTRYAKESLTFLLSQKIDVCVIACNTVSAYALDELKRSFDVPLIGVVEPGVAAVLKSSPQKAIGIIGTEATINSHTYETLIKKNMPGLHIVSKACPLFVPLVEEGWLDHPVTEATVKSYIGHFAREGVESVVLACTHYPLLKPVLGRVLGPRVHLIDSAEETALAVKERFGTVAGSPRPEGAETAPLQNTGTSIKKGSTAFFVTDQAERFDRLSSLILDKPYAPVTQVTV